MRYLQREIRMHQWIQIPVEEAKKLEDNGEISLDHGYQYNHPLTNAEIIEFHFDDHHTFLEKIENSEFGGNLSVREPIDKKPMLSFGQDECIFKQFSFTSASWTAPDGQKAVIPKDEGQGLMISAFVSREFGFGMDLSEEDLQKVNRERHGKKYSDEEAATKINGNPNKQTLTQSPLVLEFEYGANAQGYWDYD